MKTNQTKNGRIWQTADRMSEALEWAQTYLTKGAYQVDLKPRKPLKEAGQPMCEDDYHVDVIVLLDRTPEDVVNPVLDYKIDAEEWMTEDYPIGSPVLVRYEDDTLRAGHVRGRRVTEMSSGESYTEYFIEWAAGDDQKVWLHERDVSDNPVAAAQRLYAECTGG